MEQVSSTPQANLNETKPSGANSNYKITFRKIAKAAEAELRVHKKIAIISYVLFGVSTLLFMFNAHFYVYNVHPAEFSPSGWGAVFGSMGVIVGFFAALNVFRDVNNQQLCDVTMALPIKATERFFSKLLALFYLQVGPLLVATLIGNGVAILFGRMRYGDLDPEVVDAFVLILLIGLTSSLFIMSIAVLCACCSGAKAESAYFSLIMMFIINALPLTYVVSILGNVSGFTNGWYYSDGGAIDVKFWGFLPLFNDYDDMGDFVFHNVVGIAISLIVMFLSLFIYKKRDAKTVGTPIASRLFFEIFLVLGCFTIFSFFVFSEAAWWGVLIAGVIYIIINIIVSRAKINVMSFVKWIVKYAVTTVVFIAFMVVTVKTGGFGQIYSRPSAEYLDRAQYNITVYSYQTHDSTHISTDVLTAEQANQIMEITKKHMVKGFNDISVAGMLTDFINYRYNKSSVQVMARSDKEFRDRPAFGRRHFREYTVHVKNSDYSYRAYSLYYNQSLPSSSAEAAAMVDELKALDFVSYEVYKNGKTIESKYVNNDPIDYTPMTDDGQYIEYY